MPSMVLTHFRILVAQPSQCISVFKTTVIPFFSWLFSFSPSSSLPFFCNTGGWNCHRQRIPRNSLRIERRRVSKGGHTMGRTEEGEGDEDEGVERVDSPRPWYLWVHPVNLQLLENGKRKCLHLYNSVASPSNNEPPKKNQWAAIEHAENGQEAKQQNWNWYPPLNQTHLSPPTSMISFTGGFPKLPSPETEESFLFIFSVSQSSQRPDLLSHTLHCLLVSGSCQTLRLATCFACPFVGNIYIYIYFINTGEKYTFNHILFLWFITFVPNITFFLSFLSSTFSVFANLFLPLDFLLVLLTWHFFKKIFQKNLNNFGSAKN